MRLLAGALALVVAAPGAVAAQPPTLDQLIRAEDARGRTPGDIDTSLKPWKRWFLIDGIESSNSSNWRRNGSL